MEFHLHCIGILFEEALNSRDYNLLSSNNQNVIFELVLVRSVITKAL